MDEVAHRSVTSSDGLPATTAGRPPFWAEPLEDTFGAVASSDAGVSSLEAARRLATHGPNLVPAHRRRRGLRLLLAQFANPIVLILAGATVLSMVLGDLTDGAIILVIILASGLLGFWQEHNAGRSVESLLARVRVGRSPPRRARGHRPGPGRGAR
jgi:Mg2+-importing ATPase